MKKPKTDAQLLDLAEKTEAWITYASDQAGTDQAWRCYVAPMRLGYGKTIREAMQECFAREEVAS